MAQTTLPAPQLVYNSAKTAVTVTGDYSSASLKANNYESSVVTITAAARTKALAIEGNAKANKIIGTSGNDTLVGAAGNDTLTGGAGSDIFIFDAKGSDVITDYTAGEDTLKISSGSISSYSFSGNDATFKIGSGSVKISGGKNSAITVVDSKNKLQTYDGGLIYDSTVAKAKALTVSAAYGNTLASYGASVVTIDASARTKALEITGNAAANKIIGTSANDTINGGGGNDTLTGGKGNDIFIYEAGGGNDVITDYAAGSDTIKIASGSISAYSISGSDATFKIDKGTLKVSGGKNSAITIIDANGNSGTYQNGAIYNNAQTSKATAITLTAAYGNTYTASTTIITVDASERKNAINITGNTKNNFLIGGAGKDIIDGGGGNDSLRGGKGADVLTGGKGADVFIYAEGDGTDAITDYVAGEDIIKLTSGAVKSYSVKDNDAIFKIGSGAITLKGAGKDAISILDANDVLTVYNGGLIYNNSRISKADAVTITSDYEGEFHTYGASVETIDAAARTKAIEITGNGADNFILSGKGKDTINAGKGNDTIYAGKGNDLLSGGNGNDVFYFSGADGNDTITDYSAGDIISVDSAISSYSTKNSDAILKIGSGNVTLQGAAETAITIVGANGATSIASGGKISLAPNNTDTTETGTTIITIPGVPHDAFEYNGHYYYMYNLGTTWSGAKTFCESLGGHLLTITDEGEQNFIYNVLNSDTDRRNSYWLGGYRDDDLGWQWVTDENWDYTNWGVGQPDGDQKNGVLCNALMMYYSTANGWSRGVWNDFHSDGENGQSFFGTENFGFICEWGNANETIPGLIFNNTNTAIASAVTITSDYSKSAFYATNYASLDSINASGRGAVKISGNSHDNVITGSKGDDTLSGGAGNDTIYGGAGNNLVYGDAGNDLISISAMPAYGILRCSTTIDGGNGNDSIYASGSVEGIHIAKPLINGGAGSDLISIYGGYNGTHGGILNGDVDDRTIATIDGGADNDQILFYGAQRHGIDRSNLIINGGTGNDLISIYGSDGGIGGDSTYGGATVSIDGGDGFDTIAVNSIDSLSGVTIVAGAGDIISVGSGGAVYYFDSTNTATINGAAFSANSVGTSASIDSSANSISIKSAWNGTVTLSGGKSLTDINGSVVSSAGNYQLVDGKITGNSNSDFTVVSLTPNDDRYTVTGSKQIVYALAGNDSVINSSLESVAIFGEAGNDSIKNRYGSSVTIYGGDGNDSIENYYGSSVTIDGGGGNDSIYSYGNSVTINGGAGNDSIESHSGSNVTIYGGVGEDRIYNEYGKKVKLDGGENNDYIRNNYDGSSVTIDGGTGNDSIISYSAKGNVYQLSYNTEIDTIWGYNENDTIYVASDNYTTSKSGENFVITAGTDSLILRHVANIPINVKNSSGTVQTYNSNGTRVINADTLNNYILNTNNRVTIYGGAGNDSIYSYDDSVRIYGGAGNDSIYGYGDSVTIDGGEGNDSIFGAIDGGTIYGGAGNDEITTFGEEALVAGGSGNDFFYNYGSNFTIDGGDDNDSIYIWSSSAKNLSLNGGAGDDMIRLDDSKENTVKGGTGNDTVYMNNKTTVGNVFQYATGDGNDIIYNLTSYDTLQISGSYSTQKSGSDVIVSVGSGSITIKDYSGAVNIVNSVSGSSALSFSDIFEDNNYLMPSTASAIDSIIDSGGGLTDLNFSATDATKILEPEITYTDK